MNDYDVFIVPNFPLDSNYNYEIKLIVDKKLDNEALFNKLKELGIEEDKYFISNSKRLYLTDLSCLVDIKKWLSNLSNELNLLHIKSNLDSTLLNKAKELKK